MTTKEQAPTSPQVSEQDPGFEHFQHPAFTPEVTEALQGPAYFASKIDKKNPSPSAVYPINIVDYVDSHYSREPVFEDDSDPNNKKIVGYEDKLNHTIKYEYEREDGTIDYDSAPLEQVHFSKETPERKKQIEDAGLTIDQNGTAVIPEAVDDQETTEMPTADDDAPTEQLPLTPTTEQLPIEPGSEPQSESKQGTRWERLKRGFWKHMYEAPMDMTPMGPAIQPDIPFDQWYEQKHAGEPGRVGRAFNKTTDKVVDMAAATAENMGDLTAVVDYIGNIALINTAYHAGNAAAYARERLEDAADMAALKAKQAAAAMENATRKVDDAGNIVLVGMGDHASNAKKKAARKAKQLAGGAGTLTRKADDAGNAVLEGAALGAGISASVIADKTGKFTRKTDEAGNATMEDIAFQAAMAAELTAETRQKARRIGGLALDRIVSIAEPLRESLRMKYPIQREPNPRQSIDSRDRDEDEAG